jgi:hypothetical protein
VSNGRTWLMRAAGIAVLATAGLAVALVIRPGDSSLAAEAYVLLVGALGMALLAQAVARLFPAAPASRIDFPRRQRRKDKRLSGLDRIERELEMATQSAFDTHYRLRPLLRELAATRLARRGVDLDAPGGHAEELLGPDAWAFVRPDLVRPAEHHAAGAPLATVERAVDALERLA